MKNEIFGNEVNELGKAGIDNYKKIVPEEGTTLGEAKDFMKGVFDSILDAAEYIGEAVEQRISEPRYMITKNEALEGDKHPITGVPFERKIIKLPDGERIEGVFPEFDSAFDAKIPESMYRESDRTQFCECNKQLSNAIERDPKLKSMFSQEQLEQIRDGVYDGSAPDGYVWHHDAEAGKLQLVDADIHAKTGHTGGRFVWGGGSDMR